MQKELNQELISFSKWIVIFPCQRVSWETVFTAPPCQELTLDLILARAPNRAITIE